MEVQRDLKSKCRILEVEGGDEGRCQGTVHFQRIGIDKQRCNAEVYEASLGALSAVWGSNLRTDVLASQRVESHRNYSENKRSVRWLWTRTHRSLEEWWEGLGWNLIEAYQILNGRGRVNLQRMFPIVK